MATIKHTNWLNLMLGGGNHSLPDFNSDTIKGILVDNGDVTVTAGMEDLDEIDADDVATATLTVSSITSGVVTLSGALTFTSVTGDSAEQLSVYKDTGTPSTSPLTITWDSASTGLPVTPNGGNIVATWGSNQLVTLS